MNMKKIIVINGNPRSCWNTDILVREAAAGAASAGAEAEVIDLYKLENSLVAFHALAARRKQISGNVSAGIAWLMFWKRSAPPMD